MSQEEMLEEEATILTLTDDEGNELELEILDSVDYEGVEYLVLMPPEDDATEVTILEVEPQADGTECFLTVEDDTILDAVFGIFQERFKDFFTFE